MRRDSAGARLRIQVDVISPEKPLLLALEEPVSSFPALSGMQERGEVALTSPVRIDLAAEKGFDHIRVEGTVSCSIRLSCSRCLAEFDATVASSFAIFYRKAAPGEVADEEVELSEVDLVSATYSGDDIDLSEELEDQLVTEIPIKPLCSDDCRGLCPHCGTDLNRAACGCADTVKDSPFSVLKKLKADT